ncbi:MAG: phosphoserine phosphatase SerB [Candidatus Nanopelagicales bacterium]|nr:phosphoserine phosphatase SerB [Candidatus Nanopelagicales bacterium]
MDTRNLLITLSGLDRPGVTRGLFTRLDPAAIVLDIEQLVVRDRLVLAVLIEIEPSALAATIATVESFAHELELDFSIDPDTAETVARKVDRIQITLLGAPLRSTAVRRVAEELTLRGANVDRIRRIARYPVTALMLDVSGAPAADLRRALAAAAIETGVDIAVQEAGLDRRGQHLVVMDVDSTVIQDEVIDLLAEEAGVLAEVAGITERAMAGELDFTASLRERVALLAGLPETAIARVQQRISLTPGARTLCRTLNTLGYRVCLVSGGFVEVIAPLAEQLGVDRVRANSLEVRDGLLTGRVQGPIVDRLGKRRALEEFAAEFAIPMRRTIAIGDGANDIDMLEAAGLGVAFNAKAAARDAADTSVNVPYLDSVLYLLGIAREDIEVADEQAGITTPAPPLD